jgi:protein-S-isoprenylcysteine O-methyltransferase Ste14
MPEVRPAKAGKSQATKMADSENVRLPEYVFKNRGALLALPAIALVACGKPSALSVALGLPIAILGELMRCWAVGYSGATTRGDVVSAPALVTAGPYAYVRNPLYIANFVTATGFAIAFSGKNSLLVRRALVFGSLAIMGAVYATVVPHEEAFLRSRFGEAFERYCKRVPRIVPLRKPIPDGVGRWQAATLRTAESNTFATFGAMLAMLALRALRT